MRQIVGTARNIFHAYDRGQLTPTIECILILGEPDYGLDASDKIVTERVTTSVRFFASAKGLRNLSRQLAEWADDAEAQAPQNQLRPDEIANT
jgi:hypothetical protein